MFNFSYIFLNIFSVNLSKSKTVENMSALHMMLNTMWQFNYIRNSHNKMKISRHLGNKLQLTLALIKPDVTAHPHIVQVRTTVW